jgi:hypothetical protein
VSTTEDLPAQLAVVGAFLDRGPLRSTVAGLEVALTGCGPTEAAEVAVTDGVTVELLRSAIAAREAFGKLSDLIHAAAIALALPHILEPGETLVRPSLAAGNTPERLYDVETDRRVAEFKLARWDGNDGGRQQPTVKDLVRLAADKSGGKCGALPPRHAADHVAQDNALHGTATAQAIPLRTHCLRDRVR